MGIDDVKKLKERMAKGTEKVDIPAGGGQFSGDASSAPRQKDSPTDLRKGGGVTTGAKSVPEKQAVAQQKIVEAKAMDTEDSREETSGEERHDLISGKEINIPPSIIQERLKMRQNPDTGEPWTVEEEQDWRDQQEEARAAHAQAVKESELRMAEDKANQSQVDLQPITHTPISQLTRAQRNAMQNAQDSGASPVGINRAKDNATPEKIGERRAMRAMAEKGNGPGAVEHVNDPADSDLDEDLVHNEVEGEEEEDDNDLTRDADDIEADLNKK